MQVLEAMKARRSIRKYKPDSVPEEHIREVLEAARLAPSGVNIQPWRFVVAKSEEVREKLSAATPLSFVAKAPVVLACCVDNQVMAESATRSRELKEAGAFLDTELENQGSDNSPKRDYQMDEAAIRAYLGLNMAIAIDHMTLRAVELGLGTCWVMMFDQGKVKEVLGLAEQHTVVALLPLGYPDQNPAPRPRLPLESIILKEI